MLRLCAVASALVLTSFLPFSVAARAQDASALALQSIEVSQQASMLAQQAAQQASQQAQSDANNAQQAAAQASALASGCFAPDPRFSLKAGTYATPQTLLLKDRARHAAIYYTLNGWTPSFHSTKFLAPISLTSTTLVKARAFVPNCGWSAPVQVMYSLPGAPPVTPVPAVTAPNGLLRKDTALVFRFTSAATSATAHVGDLLRLELASPLFVDSRAVSSASATAYVVAVHGAGITGTPGELEFALHSLTIEGVEVPLSGQETADGQARFSEARRRLLIPVYGLSAFGMRGDQAQIAPGQTVTGQVAMDVTLTRSSASVMPAATAAGSASQ